jgi:dynein light chain LC8-type
VRDLEKNKMDKDVALAIKKEFDAKFNQTWQCVVGKDFGSEIGFEAEHMIYFYWDKKAILLWKAG